MGAWGVRRTVTIERSMISICMAKLPSNRCENTWHVYEEENEEHACRHVLQIKDASSTVGNSP